MMIDHYFLLESEDLLGLYSCAKACKPFFEKNWVVIDKMSGSATVKNSVSPDLYRMVAHSKKSMHTKQQIFSNLVVTKYTKIIIIVVSNVIF